MLKKWSKKKIVIVLLSFTVLSGLVFLPVVYSLSDKLSETTRVSANVLVVEGWIPPYAIRLAYNEFEKNPYDRIVTTGLKSTPDYFNVYTNGYLIFYTSGKNPIDTEVASHTIEIKAYSSLSGKNRARFNVIINDSVAGSFFADKQKRNYEVEWKGQLSEIDSVSVQFVNDQVNEIGDRNLFIKEIIFDHILIIPYQHNSIYVIPEINGNTRIKNDYDSYAEHARNSLLAMGIDSSLIITAPAKMVILNRTLSSAIAFRDWLKTSDIEVKGINIVSLGTHAERTWMTYNKILDKKYDIGIISLSDYRANHSRKYKVLITIRETIGIMYYWVILLPY